jgi:hypothetical protein
MSDRPTIAVDTDLRKIYAWCSVHGQVCKAEKNPLELFVHLATHHGTTTLKTRVLCEIAGPVDYTDNKAVAHNKRRWTIWNVSAVTDIASAGRDSAGPGWDTLVSPSSDWTHGYELAVRHKLAKATAKQKDLRECEAMIWSYRVKPTAWRPLPQFLAEL